MKFTLPEIRKVVGPVPTVPVEAIVCHWTGGAAAVSNLDREDYHFIVDQKSVVHHGVHSIADNIPPLRKGSYAPHCLGFNARAGKAVIGVSVTGMAGAQESPFNPGSAPIKADQMQTLTYMVAYLCITYNITVSPLTVLMHGEVQKNRGIAQRGKWDICKLPYSPEKSSNQVCAEFRAGVTAAIAELKQIPKPAPQLLLGLDGRAAVTVPNAIIVDGTWQASGQAVQPLLGTYAGKLLEKSPVRTHLARAGYVVNERATADDNFTKDAVNPRQIIYAEKKVSNAG